VPTMGGPLADPAEAPWAEGAEARVHRVTYQGVPAVRKSRPRKEYRPEALDQRLRAERLRTEVRLLRDARRAGVRTPVVLDVDLSRHEIILEHLEGPTLTEVLGPGSSPAARKAAVRALGESLGRLHAAGLVHGDLTGSNALLQGEKVAFLDLSLGSRDPGLEEYGVDLHLVEEDLNTLCADAETLYAEFLDTYAKANPRGAPAVLARAKEIQGRVRYA
jgi:Kae1-associated kinase Bud32